MSDFLQLFTSKHMTMLMEVSYTRFCISSYKALPTIVSDFCSSLHAGLKENPAAESCIHAQFSVIPACTFVLAMKDSNSRS